MSLEIEKRFRNFNYEEIIKKIKKLNYSNKNFLFKVLVYQKTSPNQTALRLRDEGHRITFTIKEKDILTNYDKEYEILVDNFEIARNIFSKIGLKENYLLEKYREIYDLPEYETELIFDHFPGLPPYIEIESKTENQIKKLCELLDLDFHENQKWKANNLYYDEYGIPLERPELSLSFLDAKLKFNNMITKNKSKFTKILKSQLSRFLKNPIKKSHKKPITKTNKHKLSKKNI